MAERSDGKGFIYFILGALVIAVGVLAWYLWSEETKEPGVSISITEEGVEIEGEGGN